MDLSILIPVYNSEEIIENLIKKIIDAVSNIDSVKSYEIILINDCSQDGSWDKIKSLSKNFSLVKGISLTQNFGQHNATMAGLNECEGEKIITMDDDLQHNPASINDLLNEIDKGFDVCYTKYLNRKHSYWKKNVSRLNNILSSYLLNHSTDLYLSSYRAIRKKIAKKIINYTGSTTYIDSLILKITKNITIIPIEHYERFHGPSNYNFKRLVSLWSDMAVDFPFFPFRLSSIFALVIKTIIIAVRKILLLIIKNKKHQYVIKEKMF